MASNKNKPSIFRCDLCGGEEKDKEVYVDLKDKDPVVGETLNSSPPFEPQILSSAPPPVSSSRPLSVKPKIYFTYISPPQTERKI